MQDDAFVVVFPSELSRPKMARLVSNIKEVLRINGQDFEFVRRDGEVVVVRANDPVFASSAISQLFGISRVAIARMVRPDLESIVPAAAKLGGNLLLRGERFLVRVEGDPVGFVPKDAEIAITSSIIEGGSDRGFVPGTETNHDRTLYTHITKRSAYVCIFLDDGHGGIPNMSQGQETVCPVYDALSAVSCIEAIRQGYQVRIAAIYGRRSELGRIAKVLNKTVRFILQGRVELEFYSIPGGGRSAAGRYDFQSSVTHLCRIIAREKQIPKISLPITSQTFAAGYVDETSRFVHESGLLLNLPLEGRGDEIGRMAREYVLDGFFDGTRILTGRFAGVSGTRFTEIASGAAAARLTVSIDQGPNSLHDILDSLPGPGNH